MVSVFLKEMVKMASRTIVLGIVVLLYGCGNDSDVIVDPLTQPLPAGTYKLAFSAISTARLAAPISGIDMEVTLPLGVSVTTATGTSGQIDSSSLTTGGAITAASLVFGSYSVLQRKAHVVMATSQEDFRGGEFLVMTFIVSPEAQLSTYDILTAHDTTVLHKVVGLDTTTHSTVLLTDEIETLLHVVR